jgi:CBS domain containing-hemolysin-like protein
MGGELIIWSLFGLELVLSFIFSGMEAGVFALSRLRIRQQMRGGRRSAKVLHDYLEHPESFLWTILVGNTLVNLLILGWLVVVLHGVVGDSFPAFAGVYCVVVFLFYACFDLLPKMLFRAFPNRLCLLLARPFRLVHNLLRPLVALVESVSALLLRWSGGKAFTGTWFGNREELRMLMQDSGQDLTSEERAMINRVLDLQTLTVRQAMTPFDGVAFLPVSGTVATALEMGRERNLTRLPVREEREGVTRTIGLINLNALLFHQELDPAHPLTDHIRPAVFLDEDLRLEVAMRRLQRSGERLGIVLGRDRREIGVISLQDILKVIFGEVAR